MTNVILVHGLWSDGSCWSEVITELHALGHNPVAAQLALDSFEDDVSTVRRLIATVDGPVLLVGWSYGGAVIGNAARGLAQVKALVYIAAFAPVEGESVSELARRRRGSLIGTHLKITYDSRSYIDRGHFGDVIAADADPARVAVAAAVQKLPRLGVDKDPSGEPAWLHLPSYYLLTTEDRAVPVQTQREMAERMGAKVTEMKSSHAPMLSRPRDVAEFLDGIITEQGASFAGA